MLYELIGIVRTNKPASEIKDVAKTIGRAILTRRGVVRGISNWGTYLLPKPTIKNEQRYAHGHHFIMRFDSDARTQHAVRRLLSLDPRMIRFSVVKMGEKLDEVCDVKGVAEWSGRGGVERERRA